MPDITVSARELFGIDTDMKVPAYSVADPHVPDLDPDYLFDRQTTLAILAGFARNRRVMVSGYHGTGKSTHIEQVAARLKWPCVRINLDSHVSRIDLVGKDAIVLIFDYLKLRLANAPSAMMRDFLLRAHLTRAFSCFAARARISARASTSPMWKRKAKAIFCCASSA